MTKPSTTVEWLQLPISADNPVPTEFRIFAKGTHNTSKGKILVDDKAVALSLEAFADQGNDLMVDYEHKSLSMMTVPGAGKAAAWAKLESRDEGDLWATRVEWTPQATAELTAREWRYFSPAVELDAERRVVRVINVALTNLPASKRMTPLMASDFAEPLPLQTKENPMPNIYASLVALPETATEGEVFSAISRIKDDVLALLSVTGASSVEKAKGTIEAWKKASEMVPALQEELAKVAEANRKQALLSLFEKGKEDRKLVPAQEAWALGQSVEQLSAYLEVAPVIEAIAKKDEVEPKGANASAAVASIVSGRKFAELSNMEKHELFLLDESAYRALEAASEA